MKSLTMMFLALGTAGVVTFASASADAQRVRTFDDQAGASGQEASVHIPGAPAPQQSGQEPQVIQQDDGDGESSDETVDAGSYQISLHGQQPQRHRQAQRSELLSKEHTELYRGIIPGKRDEVAHMRWAQQRGAAANLPNPITWVGFQPEENRTRVFFQSPRPMQYQLQESAEANELVVIFSNAHIPSRNFSRFIDASHFGRVVERIEASEERGKRVKITLQMRERVEPNITTDGGYLYLDFPHQSSDD